LSVSETETVPEIIANAAFITSLMAYCYLNGKVKMAIYQKLPHCPHLLELQSIIEGEYGIATVIT
jgi:hypothetical protein